MKKIMIVGFGVAFFGVLSAHAQVSCSPNVDKEICVELAKALNPIVDHGSPLQGIGIPVELVTPAEYEKRLSDIKEMERRETSFAGGLDAAAKSPGKFSIFYKHTLYGRGYITFFRARPSSYLVSSILIATAEFQMEFLGQDGRANSVVTIETPKEVGNVISGYLYGTISTSKDGSCDGKDLVSYSEEHQE